MELSGECLPSTCKACTKTRTTTTTKTKTPAGERSLAGPQGAGKGLVFQNGSRDGGVGEESEVLGPVLWYPHQLGTTLLPSLPQVTGVTDRDPGVGHKGCKHPCPPFPITPNVTEKWGLPGQEVPLLLLFWIVTFDLSGGRNNSTHRPLPDWDYEPLDLPFQQGCKFQKAPPPCELWEGQGAPDTFQPCSLSGGHSTSPKIQPVLGNSLVGSGCCPKITCVAPLPVPRALTSQLDSGVPAGLGRPGRTQVPYRVWTMTSTSP